MACILRNTKMDHILFSVDYPFAQNCWGLRFMEELEESGLVTKEELRDIGYRNAQKLLKIPRIKLIG
jgi:predicted TIM-barrel fold metal-dependent hydrolase